MPTFNFIAIDAQGQTVAGTMEAGSDREVAATLRKRELLPQRITEQTARRPAVTLGDFLARVFLGPPLAARMFFFAQLATMLHSGIAIGQALGSIAGRSKNRRLRKAIEEAHAHVSAGGMLSETLKRYPWLFAGLEIALIESGETAGGMDRAASQASDYLQQEIAIRQRFSRATFYPKALLLAAVLIRPMLTLIFLGDNASLRTALMTIATTLGSLFVLWALFRLVLQIPAAATAWDAVKLSVPLIGPNVRKFALAKFARATAVLYAAGVPVGKCVETGAAASGNRAIARGLMAAPDALRDGMDLHAALSRGGVLTPLLQDMVATGQITGNVDAMLDKVAEYYEAEAEAGMDRTAVILGIAAFLLVALYIAMKVISGYGTLGETYSEQMEN